MNYTGSDKKKCGFCGEYIPSDCRRCPYCGIMLEKPEEELNTDSISTDRPIENAEYQQQDENMEGYSAEVITSEESTEDAVGDEGIVSEDIVSEGDVESDEGIASDSRQEIIASEEQIILNDIDQVSADTCQSSDSNLSADIMKKPLSNGMKVFLTTLCAVIPCLGQLAGVIAAILFLNSDDADRRSFGAALLVSSLIVFVISICVSFVLVLILAVLLGGYRG